MAKLVMARIKRLGSAFASCGVGISPPKNRRKNPSMKRLCPKLVPGQVVEVPDDHNLLNQPCVEIVRRVEHDEVLRPWVFDTAEQALMANPNKARTPEQVEELLAMSEGAKNAQNKKRLAREDAASNASKDGGERKARKKAPEPEPDLEDDDGDQVDLDGGDDEDYDEDSLAERTRNRVSPQDVEEAKTVATDEPTRRTRTRRR